MRMLVGVAGCLGGLLSFAWSDGVYGLERVERFDRLPVLLEGARARQVSSRDRSGGNDDGFNSTFSFLYQDSQGEYVLFDEAGAGCVYRTWMTFSSSAPLDETVLRFYHDGEAEPRRAVSVADFFRGDTAPYLHPLVGDRNLSSGGYYSYYPVAYTNGLKVTISTLHQPFFYNMTYHRFDGASRVSSWLGAGDPLGAAETLGRVGEDPKSTNGNLRVAGTFSLPATNGNARLFSVEGAGCVQSVKIDFGDFPSDHFDQLSLVMNWDGGDAEVSAPVADFFGYRSGGVDARAFPLGMDAAGSSYCYFPMPYWERAEISLWNESDLAADDIHVEIQYATNAYTRASTGYFNAWFNEDTFGADGIDYCFLDVVGRGHLVGISVFMNAFGKPMKYLEGDERFYVDGERAPAIHGTGAEDYFNSGWYYQKGQYSLPLHGSVYQRHTHRDASRTNSFTQAYRFHVTDVIPFHRSLKAAIEHGSTGPTSSSEHAGRYASVAYFYLASEALPAPTLVAELELGDPWSELHNEYARPSAALSATNTWRFEGDDDEVDVTRVGYVYSNSTGSAFTTPLVENDGVLLRRLMDQGVAGQDALVYVDGALAGRWREADQNFAGVDKRWLESEFLIASNLVAGKSFARVEIIPRSNTTPWTEYGYQVFCLKPLKLEENADGDALPDAWERLHASSLTALDGPSDYDQDGFSDYVEFLTGTAPTNPASRFRLEPNLTFKSKAGTRYRIEASSALNSNEWERVSSSCVGTGGDVHLLSQTNRPTRFFRVHVLTP